MEALLKSDVDIVYVSQGDHIKGGPSTVVVNSSWMDRIETNSELKSAVSKRFRGKTTLYGYPAFSQLVSWVMSSDGYKLREENFTNISNDDVSGIWEFIDTMRVSSSDSCREMMTELSANRDSEAFRRTLSTPKTPPRTKSKVLKVPKSRPVILGIGSGISHTHDTIEGVLVDDLAHWAISSDNPVGTCESLCSSISRGNQRL